MVQPPPDDQFRAWLAAWIALYVEAEQKLLGGISGILRFTTPDMIAQLAARMKIKALTNQVVRELTSGDRFYAGPTVMKAIEAGKYSGGAEVAKVSRELTVASKPFDFSVPHGVRSAQAIRDDLVSSLDDVKRRITRLPDDVYKVISPAASAAQVLGRGYTPAQAQAYAWRNYVKQGITGFTDRAGRNWSLSAYVEMSVRTATQRAYNDAHLQVMQAAGIHLFTVSEDGHPCPLCAVWENRILSAEPDPRAEATIEEATAAGLFHPNAILGNQAVSPIGEVQNGVRGYYSGPSVNVTCASGVQIAVSPNHPVLTTTGWLPAKFLSEGMQVFSAPAGHRGSTASSDEDLNDVPVLIEDVLDAVAASGGRTSVPASGNDLHGDAVWIKGEIDVVLADRDLVSVVEAHGVEQRGEGGFPRADVQLESGAAFRAEQLRLLRVERSVAGPLPQFDASSLYAPLDRRAADADAVADVLAGLAVDVTPDRIVNIELSWFEGHAFDLQTATGAYVASSILVHNCRHTLLPVIDGVTDLPAPRVWTPEMQAGYDNTQKQRRIELEIRKAKRSLEYAIDPSAQAAARSDIRSAQARMRSFIDANGLLRQSRREQVDLANSYLKLPAN